MSDAFRKRAVEAFWWEGGNLGGTRVIQLARFIVLARLPSW